MSAKYYCPKCERRFVDWGAEKLGYVCPSCEGEQLLKVGARGADSEAPPTLKRKPVKAARRVSAKAAVSDVELGNGAVGGDDSGDLEQSDMVGLPDDDGDDEGGGDDSDVLSADGGSLSDVSGYGSVDEDD